MNMLNTKPYAGLKVLDFTRVLAGPYCTMLLADLGADVVKLELPETGDPLRQQGPPFHMGDGLTFLACNRNKRSLTIDLKLPEGIALARRLAEQADVLVENFRPGVMARLGLDFTTLSKLAPRLIYATISGYGSLGPDSHSGAFDLTIQALGGYMSLTGDENAGPIKLGTSAIDLAAGMNCQAAIGAALLQRLTTGRGQWVQTSLLESQVALLADAAVDWFQSGKLPGRRGAASALAAPRKAFRTRDGVWLVIDAASDDHFAGLLSAVGRPSLQRDPRFASAAMRLAHRQELYAVLEPRVAALDFEALAIELREAEVPHQRVHTVAEALSHCGSTRREMVVRGTGDAPPQLASAVSYSSFDASGGWTPPPRVGQHNVEVLADWLACSAADVAGLRERGVV
jgi:succinate--hydroxymethylglutarate CoA-transferase